MNNFTFFTLLKCVDQFCIFQTFQKHNSSSKIFWHLNQYGYEHLILNIDYQISHNCLVHSLVSTEKAWIGNYLCNVWEVFHTGSYISVLTFCIGSLWLCWTILKFTGTSDIFIHIIWAWLAAEDLILLCPCLKFILRIPYWWCCLLHLKVVSFICGSNIVIIQHI